MIEKAWRRRGRVARGRRFVRVALIAIVLGASATPLLLGQPAEGPPSEFEVKAAYLYNFGRFVRWPATPEQDTFAICVLGRDPFGPILDSILEGERLDGKPALPRRIRNVTDVENCRIVFISPSEASRLSWIIARLEGKSVLTVSDLKDFALSGGMIELVLEDGRVRFDVDLNATRAAGLNLSSELLRVARRVRGAEGGAS